jgi:hypothetical protein
MIPRRQIAGSDRLSYRHDVGDSKSAKKMGVGGVAQMSQVQSRKEL